MAQKRCPKGKNRLPCEGNGVCDPVTGACSCDPGYSGVTCSISNNCEGTEDSTGVYPCSAHGLCVHNRCECVPGFTHSSNKDDCAVGIWSCPRDCSGIGECDTGVCKCPSGYSGEACEINLGGNLFAIDEGKLEDKAIHTAVEMGSPPKSFLEIPSETVSQAGSWKPLLTSHWGILTVLAVVAGSTAMGIEFQKHRTSIKAIRIIEDN